MTLSKIEKALMKNNLAVKLLEHLKGRALHIVGPENDIYEKEEIKEFDPEL